MANSIKSGAFTIKLMTSKSSDNKSVTIQVSIIPDSDVAAIVGPINYYIGTSTKNIQAAPSQVYVKGQRYPFPSFTHSVSGNTVYVKAVVKINGVAKTVDETITLRTIQTRATFQLLSKSYELNAYPHVSISPGLNNAGCIYKFVCSYSYSSSRTTRFTANGGNYNNVTLEAVPYQNYPGTSNTTCTVTLYTYKSDGTSQIQSSYSQTFTVLAPTRATIAYKNSKNSYNIGDKIPLVITPGKSKRPVTYKITYGSGTNSWSETVTDSSTFSKSIAIPKVSILNKTSSPSYYIKITTMNGNKLIGEYTTQSKFTVNMPVINPTLSLQSNKLTTGKTYNIQLKGLISSYTYKLEYKYNNESYKVLKNNFTSSTTNFSFTPTKGNEITFRLLVLNGTKVYKEITSKEIEIEIDKNTQKIEGVKLDLTKDTKGNLYKFGKYFIGQSLMYLKISVTKGSSATIKSITCKSPDAISFVKSPSLDTDQYIKLDIKNSNANSAKIEVTVTGPVNHVTVNISLPSSKDLEIKTFQKVSITSFTANNSNGKLNFIFKGTPYEDIKYTISAIKIEENIDPEQFTEDGVYEINNKSISSYNPGKKYTLELVVTQNLIGLTDNENTIARKTITVQGTQRALNLDFNTKMITIGGMSQRTSSNGWSLDILGDLYYKGKKIIVDSNGFLKVSS